MNFLSKNLLYLMLGASVFITSCKKEKEDETKPKVTTNTTDTEIKTNTIVNNNLPVVSRKIEDKEVSFSELSNGTLLFDGDMILSDRQVKHYFGDHENNRGNIGGRAWPRGIIPFVMQPNHPAANQIQNAMQTIAQQTGVRFVPRNGQANFINIIYDPQGNYSAIGMRGGPQPLSVRRLSIGVAIHELCHAIGLLHEHSRRDRDQFVRVNFQWIPLNMQNSFFIGGWAVGRFDWRSIMLYPSNRLPNGQYDMINRFTGQPFNNAIELGATRISEGDIRSVRAIYGL